MCAGISSGRKISSCFSCSISAISSGWKGPFSARVPDELTISATRVFHLSKNLLPLPEKWHGLTDVETRFRQRYVDLIVNPDVRSVFVKRSKIIREIRNFLDERGYLEVETPVLQTIAGGALARPFHTHHNALDIELYLRIALELYLKRLIVGGIPRVYELSRIFRNEGISTHHNPEFTMLEFYQAYSDYNDLMDLSQELITRVAETVTGSRQVPFGEHVLDFDQWQRLSMKEAIFKFWPDSVPAPSEDDLRSLEKLRSLAAIDSRSLRTVGRPGKAAGDFVRNGCRGSSHSADDHLRLSGGSFAAFQNKSGRSLYGRAIRAVYRRHGNSQCLFGAERSAGTESPI